MAATDKKFNQIAGVQVNYARPKIAPYGTRGGNEEKERFFYCEPDFYDQLERCLLELWTIIPGGKPEVMTTAGFYVNKRGYHRLGRAFDLDAFFWPDADPTPDFVTLQYPLDRLRYLGIEAILRKHFGTVLNYAYNRAHRDHFHVDNGTKPVWSPSRKSLVLFLQMALTHVWGEEIRIDGSYGPETIGAINEVARKHQVDAPHWQEFLEATAHRAFSRFNATGDDTDPPGLAPETDVDEPIAVVRPKPEAEPPIDTLDQALQRLDILEIWQKRVGQHFTPSDYADGAEFRILQSNVRTDSTNFGTRLSILEAKLAHIKVEDLARE